MFKTALLALFFGMTLAGADSPQRQAAFYPCSPELQRCLDQYGLPLHGSAAPAGARSSRILVSQVDGKFCLQGLAPGRYYVESPPLYYPGDHPSIDRIFAQGGCVYFAHRQSKIIEVLPGQTIELDL